ncbi:recombinase family protein [Mesorhizobium sp. CO1-1-8]|uniref:recombinase family protein n=1 Tax=Mesorhizobium sp. CO1-1-8 TaxID=2876631 RepID=UPI001CD0B094|nr:recombinase family protein [Mesorhizobium sp. CO1-1-8]MBZ9772899.1 recombinase family protein [Mesorhizobium sp. CO1-1-8]
MNVFGYIRVSTFEQANSGESLETQKRAIEGYAMMKGWTITETFTEAGVSGSVPLAERPEGQRMLAGTTSGDIIITPKLDRMFRNATDALVTLEELKGSKVELHMLDLGGDVCGNGISKLVFTILSAVAENERDRIRERIRDVKRSMASRGLYNGGKAPFGFDVVEGGLVPNEAQQATLARMVAMRADNQSYNRIGQEVGMDMKTVSRILARQASE